MGMLKRKKAQVRTSDTFTRIVKSEVGVECVKEFRFHQVRRWRFDYAIPALKIALEVEGGAWTGGRHTRPGGFLNDMEKYNAAAMAGWTVVRTVPEDLISEKTIDMVKELVDLKRK